MENHTNCSSVHVYHTANQTVGVKQRGSGYNWNQGFANLAAALHRATAVRSTSEDNPAPIPADELATNSKKPMQAATSADTERVLLQQLEAVQKQQQQQPQLFDLYLQYHEQKQRLHYTTRTIRLSYKNVQPVFDGTSR